MTTIPSPRKAMGLHSMTRLATRGRTPRIHPHPPFLPSHCLSPMRMRGACAVCQEGQQRAPCWGEWLGHIHRGGQLHTPLPTPFGRLHEYPDDPIAIVKWQIEDYTAPLLCIDTVIANIRVPWMMALTILLHQKWWSLSQQSPLPLLAPSGTTSSSPSLCSFTYSDMVTSTLEGSEVYRQGLWDGVLGQAASSPQCSSPSAARPLLSWWAPQGHRWHHRWEGGHCILPPPTHTWMLVALTA